jgi:hypothetical protein
MLKVCPRAWFRPRFAAGMLALAVLAASCQTKSPIETIRESPHLGLPSTIDQLHSIDLQRMRYLNGFDNFVTQALDKAPLRPIFQALKQRVGFDPLRDLDQVVVAIEQGAMDPAEPLRHLVVIARGRIEDPEARLEGLHQWLGDEYLIPRRTFEQHTHASGGFAKYQFRAQSQYDEKVIFDLNFAFPDPSMMVFAGSPALLGKTLDVMAGEAPDLGRDGFWKSMLVRPDVGAMLWGMGNLKLTNLSQTLALVAPAASGLDMARQFYYQLDFGESFKAELDVVCASIDDAGVFTGSLKTVHGLLTQGLLGSNSSDLPRTAELPDKLVVYSELDTCKITLPLTHDDRRALLTEWTRAVNRPLDNFFPRVDR